MASITGFLGLGASITDGVLAEPLSTAGYARRAATVDVNGDGAVVKSTWAAFGPATRTWGPLAVLAVIAADGVTIRRRVTLPNQTVPVGGYLIVPIGTHPSTAVGAGPDPEVVTLDGVPITVDSQPLTEGT